MATSSGVYRYETKDGPRYKTRFYARRDPQDPDSPLRQVERGGFASRQQAQSYRRRQLVDIEDGHSVRPANRGKILFGEVLDEWVAQRDVAPSTLAGDKRRIRLHIRPALGGYDIRKIGPSTLATFYRDLRGSLGTSSIIKVREILVSVFKYANEEDYTPANPALLKKSHPPTKREAAESKSEMVVWTSKQAATFISWCPAVNPRARKHKRLRVAWLLALLGGLRREEICGLRAQDIDEARCRLVIRRATTPYYDEDAKKKRLSHSVTKSTRSRNVSIPRFLMDELIALPLPVSGPIFDINPEQLTAAWVRVCEDFHEAHPEAPVITLHALRHTHASMLLEANVAPKVVQSRLGHSSIQITMDTYTHVMPALEDEAVYDLEALLGQQGKLRVVDKAQAEPTNELEALIRRQVEEMVGQALAGSGEVSTRQAMGTG